MISFILDPGTRQEILSRIIVKYEEQLGQKDEKFKPSTIEEFYDQKFFLAKVKEYSEGKTRKILENEIFGYESTVLYQGWIRNIPEGKPTAIDTDDLICIEKYLNIRYSDKLKVLKRFNPEIKTKTLFGSKWWLYYLDDIKIDGFRRKILNRAVMGFEAFGKVWIKSIHTMKPYNSKMEFNEFYHGAFELYNESQGHLKIEMRTLNDEKDLRIYFSIGDGEPSAMLGIYHNFDLKLSSGLVLATRIENTDNVRPEFFLFDEPERNSNVEAIIWEYFSKVGVGKFSVPPIGGTIESLEKVMKELESFD